MDGFKINFYLQKIIKEKTYNFILVSVAWDNKRVRTTLKIHIEEKLWDSNRQRAKASSKNPHQINDRLDEIRTELKKLYDDTEKEFKRSPTESEVKPVLDAVIHNREVKKKKHKEPKKIKPFIEYFRDFIDDTKTGVRLSSAGKKIQASSITSYVSTLNHLLQYLKGTKLEITFNDIDEAFFSGLTKYFCKAKLSNNSQGKLIKNIKSCMHYYYDKGLHENRKFVKVLKCFDEQTTKIALNQAELEAIENLAELSTKHEKLRNLFLVQCYTGVRFSDLANLKPQNIDYEEKLITIYMIKTQDPLIIPMSTKLVSILRNYKGVLPKISSQKYNDGIKEICELAGIVEPTQITHYIGNKRVDEIKPRYELVSSHTARRTFITLTLKKGVNENMVMQVSGHKNKKSFQKYIRIAQSEAILEVRKAWEE